MENQACSLLLLAGTQPLRQALSAEGDSRGRQCRLMRRPTAAEQQYQQRIVRRPPPLCLKTALKTFAARTNDLIGENTERGNYHRIHLSICWTQSIRSLPPNTSLNTINPFRFPAKYVVKHNQSISIAASCLILIVRSRGEKSARVYKKKNALMCLAGKPLFSS